VVTNLAMEKSRTEGVGTKERAFCVKHQGLRIGGADPFGVSGCASLKEKFLKSRRNPRVDPIGISF
jgi:hypothetical protein